jgi:HPt (histidine-containing phosphotransfer) domain-containing protein
MINVTPPVPDGSSAPAPVSLERPIDLVHLARMTLGDRSLEREVLQLFDRQTAMLVSRIREGSRCAVAALAHTLKGSARGIGAGRVAGTAEAVELASASGGDSELKSAVERLAAAADEARAVIAELLLAN